MKAWSLNMAVQRIGILISGGDAPGRNAAIRAATLVARAQGVDVVGIERGDRGLLDGAFVPLAPADVAGIPARGRHSARRAARSSITARRATGRVRRWRRAGSMAWS